MLVVMFKPEGIAGIGQDALRRLRGRKPLRTPPTLAALFR
jgi:hypothetical protein